MIDTVIFDLGKVLVDFDPESGMKKMGFSEDVISLFKEKIFSGPWEICDQVTHTLESIKDYFLEFVPGYEKEIDILFEKLPMLTGTRPYTNPLLEDLKKQGMKLYILSNYGNVAFEINRSVYDFLDKFDGGVISYEINEIKPNPVIYEYLLKKYSIQRENAVFVDDRLENVNAAEKLGLKGIHFLGYMDCYEKIQKLRNENKS